MQNEMKCGIEPVRRTQSNDGNRQLGMGCDVCHLKKIFEDLIWKVVSVTDAVGIFTVNSTPTVSLSDGF
jgi:hypothetical protein